MFFEFVMVSSWHSDFEVHFFNLLSTNSSRVSQSYIPSVQRNKLKNINFFWKNVSSFYCFRILRQSFMANCWNLFGRVAKPAFFVFLETLYIYLKILCFSWPVSTLIKKNSAHCRKSFGRVPQTAPYVSLGTFRLKTLFCKNSRFS